MTTPSGPATGAGAAPPHLSAAELNDLVDGLLPGEQRQRAEAHLAGCADCRVEYEALRDVVAIARHARTLVQAPADVWVLVAASTVHERLVRRHVLRSMRGTFAVLALIVALASATAAALVTRAATRRGEPSRVARLLDQLPRPGRPLPALPATPQLGNLKGRLLGGAGGGARPEHGPSSTLAASVDSIIGAVGGPAASVSVAVIRERDTVVAARGLASVATGFAARPATVYAIGAIGNEYMAAAVMRLVERRALSLDDPIARMVPEVPAAWRSVTVRHLLAHTSGVPDYTELAEVSSAGADWWGAGPRDAVAAAVRRPLHFAPGSEWRYSATNYALLALAIEWATGEPWMQHVRGAVVEPLGLRETWPCVSVPRERLAVGHAVRRGVHEPVDLPIPEAPGTGGALCATALDVARWHALVGAGRVVSDESLARMTTPVTLPDGRTRPYGHGFAVEEVAGRRAIGRAGEGVGIDGVDGFVGDALRVPEESLTVVVLGNADATRAREIARDVARAALAQVPVPGSPPTRPRPE
jgi:CubicO group peptidase (beta-lactamase class C family)